MTVFEDASAIVTRYVTEPGRERAARSPVVVIADMSQVEVSSAIWRKQRMGELSPGQARVLVDAFLDDLSSSQQPSREAAVTYLPVSTSTGVLDAAVSLCGVHGLRAYDAVQLACALLARAADPTVTVFITHDVALHRAAAAEGFTDRA